MKLASIIILLIIVICTFFQTYNYGYAEGLGDVYPYKQDIVDMLKDKGYIATNVKVFYNESVGQYQWTADIERIKD